MKKILFASVTLFSAVVAIAQPGKTVPVAAKSNPHLKAFNLAASSGDINTGIVALNYYIADQGNNTPYGDERYLFGQIATAKRINSSF